MSKKKKIIRIITRLNIGGPAIHTILLAQGFTDGYFETLLAAGRADGSEGDMSYLAQEKGVCPIFIPELSRMLSFSNDCIALWKLFCLIRRERPDIIHTHTAKAGTLGRLAGIINNLISIFSFRSSRKKSSVLIHTFHGHVFQGYFSKLQSTLFVWVERFLALFTDRIVTVSENLKKELIRYKISDRKKIWVIPLGLELGKFFALESSVFCSKHHKTIGIIGRLVPIKNHRMFLDCAKLFVDRYPQYISKFIIIGGGELRVTLKNYAKKIGIDSNVEFADWRLDLENIYPGLDIVCLTSLNEGTPVSLIEAMAAEKSVIATDVGGVKDLLEPVCLMADEPIENVLVQSNDVDKFVDCLQLLLSNDRLRKRLGAAGREYVKKNFTKERLIINMQQLYNDCLIRSI